MYNRSTNKLIRRSIVVVGIVTFSASAAYTVNVFWSPEVPPLTENEQKQAQIEEPKTEPEAGRVPASLTGAETSSEDVKPGAKDRDSSENTSADGGTEVITSDTLASIMDLQSPSPAMNDLPLKNPEARKSPMEKPETKEDLPVVGGGGRLQGGTSPGGGSSSVSSSSSSGTSEVGAVTSAAAALQPRHMVVSSGGGILLGTTANGYKVSAASSSSLSGVMGTTTNGYKVWLNSYGQTAP